MPRLRDVVLAPVVYLFGSIEDAKSPLLQDPETFPESREGRAKAASGVLIEIENPKQSHLYVVTNRHVVKEGCVIPSSPW